MGDIHRPIFQNGGAVAFVSQACKRLELSPDKTSGIAERWHWFQFFWGENDSRGAKFLATQAG
jgi:hypothetical protein